MRITRVASATPFGTTTAAAVAAVAMALVPAGSGAQAPPAIRAQDLEGKPTAVVYEPGRWTLVGLTDRQHRTELADWFRALAPAVDSAQTRHYVVVALPRMVPPPFRGTIRRAFPQSGPWTYLLDWGGAAVATATTRRALPCLIAVAPDGVVAGQPCGAADSARIDTLRARLTGAAPSMSRGAQP